jgi:glycosidase
VDLATEQADPGSLWTLYKTLIALRHAQTPLSKGTSTVPSLTGAPSGVVALVREDSGKRVLFVGNVATAPTGSFTLPVSGTPTVLLKEGLGSDPTAGSGSISFPGLDPRGFVYLSL